MLTQEANDSPLPNPTNIVHLQDTTLLSPLTAITNESVSGPSSQKTSSTYRAAAVIDEDSTVTLQASSQQVCRYTYGYIL